jgi:head-tail adaptor
MQSGKFQHLITIERRVSSQSDAGDLADQWEPVPGFERIFGEVLPDRAGEFFAARQVQASRNALIRLYWQPGISEQMRVVHHVRPELDEVWDIQGCVHFQSRQRELRLMCQWWESEGYRRGADLENAGG